MPVGGQEFLSLVDFTLAPWNSLKFVLAVVLPLHYNVAFSPTVRPARAGHVLIGGAGCDC
jgi:hypothetical protein